MRAFFSCGIGDFISIESFMTDEEKRKITEFWLFTRSAYGIAKIIKLQHLWKDLPIHIPMTNEEWDSEYIKRRGIYAVYDIPHLRKITNQPWPEMDEALDFSGEVIYKQILSKQRLFNKSELSIESKKCDLVIDAESNNDPRLNAKGRNLTETELKNVYELASEFGFSEIKEIGMGKTDFVEALEYVKGATAFAGCDSMASCYAARTDKKISLVKSVNPIYFKWLPIYDPNNIHNALCNFQNKDELRSLFKNKFGNI